MGRREATPSSGAPVSGPPRDWVIPALAMVPQGGRVRLGGDDLPALRRSEIARRIAYVPQAQAAPSHSRDWASWASLTSRNGT
jgi:ABC-type cobalamin transport system ATPase subunit